ncbi:FMN-dependent NADH-azoreductase [Mesomycoplasma hyorhinis]|uniref:FMN-dependent NADH-azoreductase n=1 Tax=Mesomycoplasma hyorhinis TaxID=2100 RepID=UPI003DA53BA7
MNILVIKASVNEKRGSYSSALNDKFIEFYKEKHPHDTFKFFDLNKEKVGLTPLTGENLKEFKFWQEVDSDKWIDLLKWADKVVFSTSMTNFHYSAPAKNFIDAISVNNKTFVYDKASDSYSGLLSNVKNVQFLLAQGAPKDWYPWGNLANSLRETFAFLGMHIHNKPIVLAGTKVAPNNQLSIAEYLKQFEEEIKQAAENF